MRLRTITSTGVVAGLSLLATACGGGNPSGVARVASSTTPATPTQSGLVPFSRCMRSNGVPSFPDPTGGGEIAKTHVVAARQANPGKFDAAQTACNHLLPNGSLAAPPTAQQQRTRVADGLSFARCMRSHGVERFPDPTAQGQLSIAMVQAQGIDVRAPAVLRVVQRCLPASHGALTPAKVGQALREAGG